MGLWDPHPGADVTFAASDAHGALRGGTEAERAAVRLRLADLERRGGAPALALATLTEVPAGVAMGPLSVPAIRCAAATEHGDLPDATALVDDVPSTYGVAALARARLQLYGGPGDPHDALALAVDAAAQATGHPLAIEVRFEAHVVATWLSLELGDALQADSQADAALACLDPKRQPVTHAWLSFLRPHLRSYRFVQRAAFRVLTEQLTARYTEPVAHHKPRLGAIPLEVHGVRMAHGDDPDRYARAILMMVLAARHAGDTDRAWAIAEYGRRVGARLFGEGGVDDLALLQRALADALGPTETDRLRARVQGAASLSVVPG